MNGPYNIKDLKNCFINDHVAKFRINYIDDLIKNLHLKIVNFDFSFIDFKYVNHKNKKIYIANNFETVVLVNAVNLQIKKVFATKQQDRNLIIQQLVNLIQNNHYPMSLHKIDISSFYESINREAILDTINNSECDIYTKAILKYIFRSHQISLCGLPRGLSISATLSEIYMTEFDKELISNIDSYFCARFVDDIILITYKNSNEVQDFVTKNLQKNGLNINKNKSYFNKPLNCKGYEKDGRCSSKFPKAKCSKSTCNTATSFDFLGYEFNIYQQKECNNKKLYTKKLQISIAEKKIKKIKTRINLSILDYRKNSNFNLLKRRVEYLATNSEIRTLRSNIKIGIFYNYKHVNNIKQLKILDAWFKRILFSTNISILSLSVQQRQELAKYSFYKGFQFKIMNNFTYGDLANIVKGWKNA